MTELAHGFNLRRPGESRLPLFRLGFQTRRFQQGLKARQVAHFAGDGAARKSKSITPMALSGGKKPGLNC
jgi:hypothetical protein